MEENKLDKLFKEKIESRDNLPEGVEWNPQIGWSNYQKTYNSKIITLKKVIVFSAAAIIIGISMFLLTIEKNESKNVFVENNSSEPKEIILACGNSVWLNKYSSIEYKTSIGENKYRIKVIGEAYFEIKELKSNLYQIETSNAIVELDIPAKFNIKAYPNDINSEFTVKKGALQVRDKSSDEGLALLITEGNYCSVHISRNLVFAAANTNDNYLAWKTGEFYFDRTSMETVSDVLASYYGTKIDLTNKSLSFCKFSGRFEAKNMDLILNQIQADLDVVIENTGNKITIIGPGC